MKQISYDLFIYRKKNKELIFQKPLMIKTNMKNQLHSKYKNQYLVD